MAFLTGISLILALCSNAQAADDVSEAEHVRLSEDIEQLASRQLWSGVEKRFLELEKLGVTLTYEDLVHGAYAARALGNTQATYDRLRQAARLKGTRDVIDWLSSIDANYGHVELICHQSRNAVLTVAEMPFEPDQRTAVEASIETLKRDGSFTGLLPRGTYYFNETEFKVEPGIAVRIELSPKLKKTTGELVTVTTAPMEAPEAASGGQ